VAVVLAAGRRNESKLAAQRHAGYRRNVAHKRDGDGELEIDLPHVNKKKQRQCRGKSLLT